MKRPFLAQRPHWHLKHLVLLLLLTACCYWPLAFGVFSAKNDNIVQFLPVRFQVSEALRHGHLPLWTPYMYLGYPVMGDMQGGAWNPLVWLISVFGRYNVTSLHAEILLCIFLGGAGMYRLLATRRLAPPVRLTGAAAYLMCGYITDVGGSNLPFLAVVAFLPFVLAYYYQFLCAPSWKDGAKTAIALWLLFVSGYPSFFITVCYILAAGCITMMLRDLLQKKSTGVRTLATGHAWIVLLFLGLSAPAIFSYAHVLPFYQRGSGVELAGALQNSFHPSCSLSFLLPSVPAKEPAGFTTDLISRNAYFNSFFLVFLCCYAWARKSWFLNFTMAGLVFFFLFSLGGATPLRSWCYHLLPLMNTFRHPSNARLFVIIAGIVLGASLYQQFLSGLLPARYPRMAALLMVAVLAAALALTAGQSQLLPKWQALLHHQEGLRPALKEFFDQLGRADLLLADGIIQLALLALFAWLLRSHRQRWLPLLFLANSFLLAQLALPYTLVSKTAPQVLNKLLGAYPNGYPVPDTTESIAAASASALDHFDTLGITAFYQKKIATTTVAFTPTFMSRMEQLYQDSAVWRTVRANPYAYFATALLPAAPPYEISKAVISNDGALLALHPGTAAGSFRLQLWNNGFHFTTSSGGAALLCLEQLYLPGWSCRIDGKEAFIGHANLAFMAVAVPPGAHEVVFRYRPRGLLAALVFSLLSALAALAALLKKRKGELNP